MYRIFFNIVHIYNTCPYGERIVKISSQMRLLYPLANAYVAVC